MKRALPFVGMEGAEEANLVAANVVQNRVVAAVQLRMRMDTGMV